MTSTKNAPQPLVWAEAPRRIEYGGGMMGALIALGKDHVLMLYAEREALPLVGPALHDVAMVAPNPWRDAVTDALVSGGIYSQAHDSDPRKAVADLIAWEVKIALDTAVSAEAAALVQRGQSEERARIAAELRRRHEQSKTSHNFYACLARELDEDRL